MSEDLREAQARAQEPAAPICEADRRNRQALYAISIQKGTGAWCLGQIEHILRGDEPDTCED
jgi:hypothetical protein